MKNFTFYRTTLFLLFLLFGKTSFSQITAIQAIQEMGRGINMGNTLDAPNEGEWAGVAQEYYFDMYKEAGFKTVRIPITWQEHISSTSPYTIDATFMNRVEEIIDWALSRDFYVIMNAHHEGWIKENYSTEKNRFDALWTQVADRFKNKSEKLFFEILNEPHGAITAAQVDELNARVLGIIRQNNPTRNVLYMGAGWGNSPDLLNAAIPDANDPYLIGSYHSYDPWQFAGESQGTWGTANDIQAMIDKMAGVKTWSDNNNIPVLIGEFGAMHDCDYDSRMKYYATYVEHALAHGMAFTVWDDDGWFQALMRSQKKWNDLKDILIYTSDSSITAIEKEMVDEGVSVQLSWTSRANESLLSKVVVEKKTASGDFIQLAELAVGTYTYKDENLNENEYTFYRIVDVYNSGEEIPSYPISALRVSQSRSPYAGVIAIPGTLEAENYDVGFESVTYHDSEPANQGEDYRVNDGVDIDRRTDGGHHVGWVEAGEWLEYTVNVASSGTYKVTAHIASVDGGGTFKLTYPSGSSPAITAPKTNDWNVFETVDANVDLEAGEQIIRLNIVSTPAFNIDKLEFSQGTSVERLTNAPINIKTYPNPATEQLIIESADEEIKEIKLFTSSGRFIQEKIVNNKRETINVAKYNSGIYYLVIETRNGLSKMSFVKK